MTDTAIEARDEQVAEAITHGKGLRLIRKEFSLTEAELDQILERLWPLSTEARLRMIRHDVGCLQKMIEKFYEKALAGDVNSGVLCVRAWERKAALLGLDATRQIDLQIIRPPDQPTQHERIKAAIMGLVEREPPAKREAINLIGKIGGERALELLKAGCNGVGAVDALSPPDDTEPNH